MPLKNPHKISEILVSYDGCLMINPETFKDDVLNKLYHSVYIFCKNSETGDQTTLYVLMLKNNKPLKNKKRLYRLYINDPIINKPLFLAPKQLLMTTEDVDEWIQKAVKYFKEGKYLISLKNDTTRFIGCFERFNLTYRQVQKILSFEHNASRFLKAKPLAVRTKNPKDIDGSVDCGDFVIEAQNMHVEDEAERNEYYCITHNPDIIKWLKEIKNSY